MACMHDVSSDTISQSFQRVGFTASLTHEEITEILDLITGFYATNPDIQFSDYLEIINKLTTSKTQEDELADKKNNNSNLVTKATNKEGLKPLALPEMACV